LQSIQELENSSLHGGVVLDLTPNGCRQVMKMIPSAIIIALLPDDPGWLFQRLLGRDPHLLKEINARTNLLHNYLNEINQLGFCTRVYVGFSPDSWDETFENIKKIVCG